jgi:hypothetical protein
MKRLPNTKSLLIPREIMYLCFKNTSHLLASPFVSYASTTLRIHPVRPGWISAIPTTSHFKFSSASIILCKYVWRAPSAL